MKTINYTITDELGLHARPAGILVKMLSGFACAAQVGTPRKMVDGKRIIGVMGLGVKQGDELTVTFDGPGEEEAAEKALAFLQENL